MVLLSANDSLYWSYNMSHIHTISSNEAFALADPLDYYSFKLLNAFIKMVSLS